MNIFAQNYPQLMNQAIAAGYSDTELLSLKKAFDIALLMSDGIYRAQGVPLLNHLTSTASIVLAEKGDSELVIVALLHAAYVVQLFDHSTRSRKLQKRRQELTELVGDRIESLIWKFERMPWYRQTVLEQYNHNYPNLDDNVKKILLIRLANELDDYLDNATEYTIIGKNGVRSEKCLLLCKELAEKMDLSVISEKFREASETKLPPQQLKWQKKQGYELTSSLWIRSDFESVTDYIVSQLRRVKQKFFNSTKHS